MSLLPPTETGSVHAGSVLVVAPHYDDEVLGCGGLVARLAAAGSVVRVLFLTDGGGGEEGPGPQGAGEYSQRRRTEAAAAAAVLGITGAEHAGLPDGALEHHLEAAGAALRRALLSLRPELLLVPSPLEVSRDHRAAFAALHRLLAPLRGEGDLDPAARDLAILLYEVNRPAYPDLLVDVSGQLETIGAAMACYASQQQRHDYLAAALGLRRFRTLSLPAGTAAVEGYRRLGLSDFVTRSPAQLIRHLGGVPELLEVRDGPRISIVVRTFDRPELLAEALASLAAGSYRPVEVVLVNDGGAPPSLPADFPLPVVRVDLAENRGRAAAAAAGVAAATGSHVGFLDDDDLAAPEHLTTLAGLVSAAGVRVAYTDAAVAVYELAPSGWCESERRLPYSRDFDPDLLLVDNYVPFNTLLIERELFAEAGGFDPDLPFFEDWDFLIRLAALTRFHHLRRVTCEYRHFRGGGHHVLGDRPRERVDFLAMKARVIAKHAVRLGPAALARIADTLRAERIESDEAATAARRRAAELTAAKAALDERFHRLNGEVESLRAERARLGEEVASMAGEVERVYGEEKRLSSLAAEEEAHIGRLYAEIERLNRIVREMEGTRAWRFHQWWQRRVHS